MSSKLNILFISSWFPSKYIPTLGNFVAKHAKSIALLHHVFVIHVTKVQGLDTKYEIEKRLEGNAEILQLYFRASKSPLKCWNKLKDSFLFFQYYLKLFKMIEEPIDLVHANVVWPIGLLALYLKFRYRLRYVLTEHWTIYLPENREKVKLFWFKLINKMASRVLPVSTDLQKMMIETGIHGRFSVVPNTVNVDLCKYKPIEESDSYKLIHISTLVDRQKNIKGILRAYSRLLLEDKTYSLTIISDGEIEPIRSFATHLGIGADKIRFLGTQSPEQIAAYLHQSNAYVQFSNYETFGIVPAEALCCGRPVISTQVGFLKDYDEKQIGIVVPIRNEEALLQAMKSIKNLNFDGRAVSHFFTQRFSEQQVAEMYSEVYKQVIAQQ